MKLKERPTDFKVFELLRDDVLVAKGDHRVYRVTKRKQTSLEAAQHLAELAGASAGDVSMAGMKDRQGVTVQYMSLPKGRPVDLNDADLTIETVGAAREALDGEASDGNRFEIVARDLAAADLRHLRAALPAVREHGLPNYFDEQRFGNLRHEQGWIALALLRGKTEEGLKRLLTTISPFEPPKERSFKNALFRNWGHWGTCRDIAGRHRKHHSLFEHLKKQPEDFAGAFRYISTRVRLIHAFAYQSHLWNRAAARAMSVLLPRQAVFGVTINEGLLLFNKGELELPEDWKGGLPLPGAGLEDLLCEDQRDLYEVILEHDRLTPEDYRIEGVPGFALKAVPREFLVHPRELRVRPAEPDPLFEGRKMVRLSFELPRGSYATLVLRRLFGSEKREDSTPRGRRGGGQRREYGGRHQEGGDRRDHRGGRGPGGHRSHRPHDGRRDDHR